MEKLVLVLIMVGFAFSVYQAHLTGAWPVWGGAICIATAFIWLLNRVEQSKD